MSLSQRTAITNNVVVIIIHHRITNICASFRKTQLGILSLGIGINFFAYPFMRLIKVQSEESVVLGGRKCQTSLRTIHMKGFKNTANLHQNLSTYTRGKRNQTKSMYKL